MSEVIKRRIVVAEDEEGIRNILVEALESEGYNVTGTSDGSMALKIVNTMYSEGKHIDLLISDIKMPVMNGIELIENLEKRGIFAPVLVLTGYGDKELLIELLRRGCRDYLDKPFKLSDLIRRVETVVIREDEARGKIAEYIAKVEKARNPVNLGESRIGAVNRGVAVRKIEPSWLILDIVGELTEDTATMLRAIAEDNVDKGARKVIVNLTSSGYFSSYGMGVIVYLWKRLTEAKGQLSLITGDLRIRQKIDELNLSRVMRVFDSENDFKSALSEGWLSV
ncbi:MAG: response regulator [Fibrobacteres bacterium]|nr:response regulator [Fibrobacterota bacterium]